MNDLALHLVESIKSHEFEWRTMESAPADGTVVEVMEVGGARGLAHVVGIRPYAGRVFPFGQRHSKYIWHWTKRVGKAYPYRWRPCSIYQCPKKLTETLIFAIESLGHMDTMESRKVLETMSILLRDA